MIDELAVYSDRAALLDPLAYAYATGVGISTTVPTGRTWHLVNGMFLDGANLTGDPMWYHREADCRRALALPAGTVLQGTTTRPSHNAFWYLCKPEAVNGDRRYLDPRGLYYERLHRLSTLPLKQVSVHVAAGSAMTADPTVAIPETAGTRVLVTHVSSEDVAWLALTHSTNGQAINTLWELDNDHRMRQGRSVLLPFVVGTHFDSVKVACANTLGDPAGVSLEGHGTITYVVLPGDW